MFQSAKTVVESVNLRYKLHPNCLIICHHFFMWIGRQFVFILVWITLNAFQTFLKMNILFRNMLMCNLVLISNKLSMVHLIKFRSWEVLFKIQKFMFRLKKKRNRRKKRLERSRKKTRSKKNVKSKKQKKRKKVLHRFSSR